MPEMHRLSTAQRDRLVAFIAAVDRAIGEPRFDLSRILTIVSSLPWPSWRPMSVGWSRTSLALTSSGISVSKVPELTNSWGSCAKPTVCQFYLDV